MTKDEILYEINKQMIIEAGFDPFFFTFNEFIKKQNEDEEKKEMVAWAKRAMDLYAKQQLIEYSEWLRKENWEGRNHIGWINHTHQQDFLGNRAFYTDENIVNQFIEQQNK